MGDLSQLYFEFRWSPLYDFLAYSFRDPTDEELEEDQFEEQAKPAILGQPKFQVVKAKFLKALDAADEKEALYFWFEHDFLTDTTKATTTEKMFKTIF